MVLNVSFSEEISSSVAWRGYFSWLIFSQIAAGGS